MMMERRKIHPHLENRVLSAGMGLQALQVNELQRRFVSGFQDDIRRASGYEGFLPAGGAQTPLIARLESGKSEFRTRRAQVVAPAF
jgi:hypothetical protein